MSNECTKMYEKAYRVLKSIYNKIDSLCVKKKKYIHEYVLAKNIQHFRFKYFRTLWKIYTSLNPTFLAQISAYAVELKMFKIYLVY